MRYYIPTEAEWGVISLNLGYNGNGCYNCFFSCVCQQVGWWGGVGGDTHALNT